ncbi:MerR family transcriptional regulator [Actinacidiphila acididurans]|uniref:MerR family transcriptional regulator n=1 Tax=Actinacidiphila acididurans TaxID=2784346 RepID=A0ABS2TWV3_9ACTN|nr:MerR family transcriptional regulator [Actinacidiphila acididurans]MBM9507824.1 MerR family transcriptional regulator [Actinacidiphila acididurans]
MVAARAGVSVRALRYYEEQGLLVAARGPGDQRQYSESDVERVKFIQLLYSAGLPSKAILPILPFMDTLVATPEMTQQLTDERDRIQARIHDLTRARERLDELIGLAAQYTASSPAQCPPDVDTTPDRPRKSGRAVPSIRP